jgi:hypothetical protein
MKDLLKVGAVLLLGAMVLGTIKDSPGSFAKAATPPAAAAAGAYGLAKGLTGGSGQPGAPLAVPSGKDDQKPKGTPMAPYSEPGKARAQGQVDAVSPAVAHPWTGPVPSAPPKAAADSGWSLGVPSLGNLVNNLKNLPALPKGGPAVPIPGGGALPLPIPG